MAQNSRVITLATGTSSADVDNVFRLPGSGTLESVLVQPGRTGTASVFAEFIAGQGDLGKSLLGGGTFPFLARSGWIRSGSPQTAMTVLDWHGAISLERGEQNRIAFLLRNETGVPQTIKVSWKVGP